MAWLADLIARHGRRKEMNEVKLAPIDFPYSSYEFQFEIEIEGRANRGKARMKEW